MLEGTVTSSNLSMAYITATRSAMQAITPRSCVSKLEQASRTVIADPELQKKFLALT